MASPLITAWQSQPASMRSRPSTKTSLRLDRQRRDGARERPQRRPQDVVAVDARGRREGDRDLGVGANPGVELFARLGIELLGIVEPARHALGIENDRRGDDRTGKRSPARLVAARDRPDAALDRRALAAEGRTDVLLAERQARHAMGAARLDFAPPGFRDSWRDGARRARHKSTASACPDVKGGEKTAVVRRLGSEQAQLLRGRAAADRSARSSAWFGPC